MAACWHHSPQQGSAMLNIILNIVLDPKQIIITVMAIVKGEFTFNDKELNHSVTGNLSL